LDLLNGETVNISAAIAIYPGCSGVEPWSSTLPVHLFLGEADDITPPGACRSLAGSVAGHLPVTVQSFAEARHGFDIEEAPASISTGRGTTVGYNRVAAEETWRMIREILSGR
jgi:dienelactone hydrolase